MYASSEGLITLLSPGPAWEHRGELMQEMKGWGDTESPPLPKSSFTFTWPPLQSRDTESPSSKTQSKSSVELFLWEIWGDKKPTGFGTSEDNTRTESDTRLGAIFRDRQRVT